MKYYINHYCVLQQICSVASAIRSMAFWIPTSSAVTGSDSVWTCCVSEKSVKVFSTLSSMSLRSLHRVSLCSCCGSHPMTPSPGTGGKMVGNASPLTLAPRSTCREHTHSLLTAASLSESLGIVASHSLHRISSAVQTYSR